MNQEDYPEIISQLCRQFYQKGWMTGSGGAVSIRQGSQMFMTPSGVQKELIQPSDIFTLDLQGTILNDPSSDKDLTVSQCTPVFLNAYNTKAAGSVIHFHSKNATLASLISPGREFQITHQQPIRGVINCVTGRNYGYDEKLVLPIIENTCREIDLIPMMKDAMRDYPEASAVIVRRHGVYVWGPDWQRTKIMCECLDYLFDMAVEMKKLGLDPAAPPKFPADAYLADEHKSAD